MSKYYFLSDAHIGTKAVVDTQKHQRLLIEWLDMAKKEATEIFLVGDIFDFWFEYKRSIPIGYSRLLGKLAEITDSGIPVHFFIGNHDLWTFGFLENEIGLIVHRFPQIFHLNGKKFFIAHGDGLNDKSKVFRLTRFLFHNRFTQKCFSYIHPNIGIWAGQKLSNHNRSKHSYCPYKGEENEFLIQFAKENNKESSKDFFIFGHRHILLNLQISPNSNVVILGDFYEEFSYAVFDDLGFHIENFIASR